MKIIHKRKKFGNDNDTKFKSYEDKYFLKYNSQIVER